MSKYSVNQTVLREDKYLVEALKEMGYEVEVHREGGNLNSLPKMTREQLARLIAGKAIPPQFLPPEPKAEPVIWRPTG